MLNKGRKVPALSCQPWRPASVYPKYSVGESPKGEFTTFQLDFGTGGCMKLPSVERQLLGLAPDGA